MNLYLEGFWRKNVTNNVAVFFDAENVSSQYASAVLAKVSSYGNVLIQRTYADWSIPNTKSWKETLVRQLITVIQQFHHGESQVVDKAIIMDAIQIAIERQDINIFCIVASDKGYSNLALRLRELGKYVLGMGEEAKAKEVSLLVKENFKSYTHAKLEQMYRSTLFNGFQSDWKPRTVATLPSYAFGNGGYSAVADGE